MSHRTADQRHHLREARQYIGDTRIDQSVAAFDAMARGKYKGAHSRTSVSDIAEHARPGGEVWDRNTPEAIREQLARDAVIPDALAIACTAHDAEPGVYCYRGAHGVCGTRLDLRPRHA